MKIETYKLNTIEEASYVGNISKNILNIEIRTSHSGYKKVQIFKNTIGAKIEYYPNEYIDFDTYEVSDVIATLFGKEYTIDKIMELFGNKYTYELIDTISVQEL